MKKTKIINYSLFIYFFIVFLSFILIRQLKDLDEIWNYNFARNVANGLIPYKDFNMLQMPLLPLICGGILKFFKNELFVMRILSTILITLILCCINKILKKVEINKDISLIFTILIGYMVKDLFCIDYNFFTLLLCLYIVYLEIKTYKKNKDFFEYKFKNEFVLGLLAGSTLILKQTTGLFICIALLGNKLLFVRKSKEFKKYLKIFMFRLLGIIIPFILTILYLIINNAFDEFINYTIRGMSGFTNYVSYINLIKLNIIGLLSILVPLAMIYAWIKSIILERDKILYILLVYSLAMFIVCFPISDEIHFKIGITPSIVMIMYMVYYMLKKYKINEKFKLALITFTKVFFILVFVYLSVVNYYNYINDNKTYIKYFKYIPISYEFENNIKSISDYISENNNTIILDASAAIFMIPLDKYNKNYDMLLKGNLGENGENKIIEEISKSKDVNYLVLKDKFKGNWQLPLNVIDYVKENKQKIGEIYIFDVYR